MQLNVLGHSLDYNTQLTFQGLDQFLWGVCVCVFQHYDSSNSYLWGGITEKNLVWWRNDTVLNINASVEYV